MCKKFLKVSHIETTKKKRRYKFKGLKVTITSSVTGLALILNKVALILIVPLNSWSPLSHTC